MPFTAIIQELGGELQDGGALPLGGVGQQPAHIALAALAKRNGRIAAPRASGAIPRKPNRAPLQTEGAFMIANPDVNPPGGLLVRAFLPGTDCRVMLGDFGGGSRENRALPLLEGRDQRLVAAHFAIGFRQGFFRHDRRQEQQERTRSRARRHGPVSPSGPPPRGGKERAMGRRAGENGASGGHKTQALFYQTRPGLRRAPAAYSAACPPRGKIPGQRGLQAAFTPQ